MSADNPDRYATAMIRGGLFLTLAAALILMALGHAALAKGAALGGLASAANFFLMARLMRRALTPSRKRAEAFSVLSLIIRFGVMAAALALCLLYPRKLSVFACMAGLFSVQICVIAERLFGGRFNFFASGSRR